MNCAVQHCTIILLLYSIDIFLLDFGWRREELDDVVDVVDDVDVHVMYMWMILITMTP